MFLPNRNTRNFVQFLQNQKMYGDGKNPYDMLAEEKSIRIYHHPDHEELVGLKYCQIKSPRTDPIVRECRGIVMNRDNNTVVAKPFTRFFNVGEHEGEAQYFNWRNFQAVDKEDGSLCLVYFYDGLWQVNTSGSFGFGRVSPTYSGSWRDLFWENSGNLIEWLRPYEGHRITFVFELCTLHNKVVRRYTDPGVYLIGAFATDGSNQIGDYDTHTLQNWAEQMGVKSHKFQEFYFSHQDPATAESNAKERLTEYLKKRESEDPTFEGVVLRDNQGFRFKWKTPSYLALHHLKDNGNIMLPKRLVPICMAGEHHEISAYMPECSGALNEVKQDLTKAFTELNEVWLATRETETQKSFALSVKDHPFFWILFQMRKKFPQGGTEELESVWRDERHHQKIAETLFGKRVFEYSEVK